MIFMKYGMGKQTLDVVILAEIHQYQCTGVTFSLVSSIRFTNSLIYLVLHLPQLCITLLSAF